MEILETGKCISLLSPLEKLRNLVDHYLSIPEEKYFFLKKFFYHLVLHPCTLNINPVIQGEINA